MGREPWPWRTGMSKVKSMGWLEWTGPADLRSPARGARETPRSPAMERGMGAEDDLSSARGTEKTTERGKQQTVSGKTNKQVLPQLQSCFGVYGGLFVQVVFMALHFFFSSSFFSSDQNIIKTLTFSFSSFVFHGMSDPKPENRRHTHMHSHTNTVKH